MSSTILAQNSASSTKTVDSYLYSLTFINGKNNQILEVSQYFDDEPIKSDWLKILSDWRNIGFILDSPPRLVRFITV